ncbi:hypothetical protein GCM10010317_034420 [Streptomyces mirabilis]|nr:hypothetical protein GCM10010317_034420 [Streptomyces mirabilis]
MQLVRDELVGETAGEGHEVVSGDGAGDCDTHGEDTLLRRKGIDSSRYPVDTCPLKRSKLPDSRSFFVTLGVHTVPS